MTRKRAGDGQYNLVEGTHQFCARKLQPIGPVAVSRDDRVYDKGLLAALSKSSKHEGKVKVFLLNKIRGLNAGGASYLDSNPGPTAFVQLYDKVDFTSRAFAHEMGHLLSLDHIKFDYDSKLAGKLVWNLVREGIPVGPDLSKEQVAQARDSKLAKRY